MSFLQRVRLEKEEEVAALLAQPPDLHSLQTPRSLSSALSGPTLSAIAEIKRRSPSRGAIAQQTS